MKKIESSRQKCAPYLLRTAIAASLGLAVSGSVNAALEEVIVTAQKRDQSVQEVPVSITALTQDALETNRVASVTDLSGLAPNLIARPAAGGSSVASFSMRGITSYGVVPGSDKEISVYLDGVYIGSPRGSIFNLPDIAQLEVLRGPQGTLFGRNATAGAINITTRDPAGQFGARQELSFGDYDYFRTRTSIDSSTWGPFSFRATYMKEEKDGDIKNLGGGTVWTRAAPGYGTFTAPDRLGDKDAETYFLAAKFEPTDTFNMVYKYDRAIDKGSPAANVPNSFNSSVSAQLTGIIQNQTPPIQFAENGGRPDSVNNAWAQANDLLVEGHSLTTVYDVNENVSVKNISSIRNAELLAASDLSGLGGMVVPGLNIPFCGNCFQTEADSDQWSTEFQGNIELDSMTITVGALYFDSDDRSGSPMNQAISINFNVFPTLDRTFPAGGQSVNYNQAKSYAGYTQVEYHLNDEIDLLAGYRWTKDEKSGDFVYQFPTLTSPMQKSSFDFDDSRPSYMFGVNYKPTYDTLVYLKYSQAFVSGGMVSDIPFEAEEAKSWEAGLKTDFLDSQLRSNLSVFDVTYDNVQIAQGGVNLSPPRPELGTAVIDLGGEAHAYGFEWEGSASVGYGVTLNASLGFTHVYYDEVSPVLLNTVNGSGIGQNYPNSKVLPTLIPDWTGGLSAQYQSQPLFGTAYFAANIDGSWRDKMRILPNPAQADSQPGAKPTEYAPESWVVNARASLKEIDLGNDFKGEVGLWGRNLTDYDDPIYSLNQGGLGIASNYMDARSYGVDFVVEF